MDIKRAYRRLVALYPKDYQFRFAAEMSRAFEAAADEHLRSGRMARARFMVVETAGLLQGVGVEWFTKWTTDASVRSRELPDLRMMPLPWVPQDARYRCLRRLTRPRRERCSPDTSQ